MTYYGAAAETNLNEPDDLMNYSHDNLVNNDYNNYNSNRNNDYKSDYDTEINKELQILDPITGQTVDNLPTTVKIPTVSGDETDLMNKKLMTEKQKFLGIQKNHFYILCVAMVILLLAAIAGLVVSVVMITSDSETSYDWKIFGIVVCAVAIIVVIGLFIFILAYSRMRHQKFKKALYEELNNTDSQGNPLKTATLEKMFKHSKPIKAAPPPPPPKSIIKQAQPQIPATPRYEKQVIITQPAPRPQQQKIALLQKVVNKMQAAPNPVIPAPLMIPAEQAFRTSPSNIQLVEMKKPITPGLIRYGNVPMHNQQILLKQ